MAKMSSDQKFSNQLAKVRRNRASELVVINGISDEQRDRIVVALKDNHSLAKMNLNYRKMGDSRIAAIAGSLLGHPNLQELSLIGNEIGVDGAHALGAMLAHPECRLKYLDITSNPSIGDAGMQSVIRGVRQCADLEALCVSGVGMRDASGVLLGDAIQHLKHLRELNFGINEIGRNGGLAIAAAAATIPTMSKILMGANPVDEKTVLAMGDAFVRAQHKNILEIASNHPLSNEFNSLCSENRAAALDGIKRLDQMASIEMGDPAVWWQIAERLPAMYSIVNRPSEQYNKLNRFKSFMDSLPEVDFTQPLTLSALTEEQERYAPIDNPKTWFEWERVVQGLNQNGYHFRHKELVGEDGEISAFCRSVIAHDRIADLFTRENWAGAPKSELQETLRAMPEEVLDAIPNRHQLLAAVGSDERAMMRR